MRISISPQEMFRLLRGPVKKVEENPKFKDMVAVMEIKNEMQTILVTPVDNPTKFMLVMRENGSWEAYLDVTN